MIRLKRRMKKYKKIERGEMHKVKEDEGKEEGEK